MSETERQQIIAAALRDVMNAPEVTSRGRRRPPPNRPRQRPLMVVMIMGWALVGWIWIARPAALFSGSTPARVLSAEQREASLRYAIYLQRHEVAAYAREHGQLPSTLAEVELDPAAGLVLEREEGGRWAVVGTQGGEALRLTDRMDADSFLGSSLTTLTQAR